MPLISGSGVLRRKHVGRNSPSDTGSKKPESSEIRL
jgi:hypothetical protein